MFIPFKSHLNLKQGSLILLHDLKSWNLVRRSHPEVFVEEVFLEISQNSQENTCARPATLLKRDSGTGIFL